MKAKCNTLILIVILILMLSCISSSQTRIKDISKIYGLEEKSVSGFGLVTGLNGTGDGTRAIMTIRAFANLLKRMDINIEERGLRMRNIAGVLVTATIPPFSRRGDKIDVNVSSIGDAKSLQGGTLIRTELYDLKGEVIAYAQGPVSIGGIVQGLGAGGGRTNFELAGRVPSGAKIERNMISNYIENGEIRLKLNEPDFTSATRVIGKINREFGENTAYANDAATVSVKIPKSYFDLKDEVGFISMVENLVVDPDIRAKVVINERTGTVVVGDDVTIETVAISHGDLSIEIRATDPAGQQGPPQQGRVVLYQKTAKVGDLAVALNALRVTPEDIIAIFQALKELGALNAELVIM